MTDRKHYTKPDLSKKPHWVVRSKRNTGSRELLGQHWTLDGARQEADRRDLFRRDVVFMALDDNNNFLGDTTAHGALYLIRDGRINVGREVWNRCVAFGLAAINTAIAVVGFHLVEADLGFSAENARIDRRLEHCTAIFALWAFAFWWGARRSAFEPSHWLRVMSASSA